MTRSQQINLGLKSFGQATGFIFRNKLGWTFLVPVALNILLFIGGQALLIDFTSWTKDILLHWLNIDKEAFWGGFIGTLLSILTEILFFFVFAYISGYIILILLSPLLAWLSEKTEEILTGKKYNTNFSQLMKDIGRGISIAIRNLFIEIFFIIIMFFVNFIPLVGWIGTIALFFVSSYFYGFSFIDYINERQKLNVRDSVSVIRKYRWISISIGASYSVFLLIPFCGAFISVFIAIVSTVAATLAMHKTNAYSEEPD